MLEVGYTTPSHSSLPVSSLSVLERCRGRNLNSTQDCGQMNQHWRRPPQDRRQLLQWSRPIRGRRVLTAVLWELLVGVGRAPGTRGRDERAGMVML